LRKLIAFDDDTFDKLTQLGRDRMATIQELADEAFADVLKKHGIPIDLKDALRKSAAFSKTIAAKQTTPTARRKTKS
jgi:hypothetical protein